MTSFRNQTVAAAVLPTVATMLFVQACGGSDTAIAQGVADPMEGVWEAVVTARDCTTNAVTGTFLGVNTIHRGGTLSDTNAAGPATRGPGFGIWSRGSDGVYAIRFRFYRFNADGSLAGTNVVASQRTLSADGNGYTGETRTEVRNLAGATVQTVCVSDVGTRFR